MTTIGPTQAPPRPPANPIFDLQPPQAGRRSRVPEVALGLLLVVGGALAALVWQISANQTTSVLAVARDVAQGQPISRDDLELVQVRSNERIRVLGAGQTDQVVGLVARTDLVAGTLLTPEHVRRRAGLAPGQALVGLSFKSGEVPSLKLAPGDRVAVILTPGTSEADTALKPGAAAVDRVLAKEAEVVEVARSESQGTWFVSISVTQGESTAIAQAAAVNRARLVQVPQGS